MSICSLPRRPGLFEDGDTLTAPITAFRQFFADNFPGEDVAADVVGVRVDGDSAEADYLITVSGGPVIDEVQTGSLTRTDGTWRFDPTSFCELVALGGTPCPA